MRIIILSRLCPEKIGISTSRWMILDDNYLQITDHSFMLNYLSKQGKLDTDYKTRWIETDEGRRIVASFSGI